MKLARHDAQVRRFLTVPGVGPKNEEDRERSPCEVAIDRYTDIDLSGTFLSPKLIGDIFVKGIVEPLEIQAYLDKSSHCRAAEFHSQKLN
jgi:hypothetical protein